VQEWEKRHAAADALKVECERLEKQHLLEMEMNEVRTDHRSAGREDIDPAAAAAAAAAADPNAEPTEEQKKKADKEQRHAFHRWFRGGDGNLTPEQRSMLRVGAGNIPAAEMPAEVRALTTTVSSTGLATVPQGFVYQLEVAQKWYGGIISEADYIDTTSGAALPWPSMNDTGNQAEQTAENVAVTTNTTVSTPAQPAFASVTFNAYILDTGVILCPITLLQDSAFNIDTFLEEAMRIRMGRKLNNLATVGSGSNTLTGVVTAATLGKTGASPTSISYNEMLDLEHSVDPSYRTGAKFMFNDNTLKALKKLTDNNGRPLWIAGGVSEGVQGKRPDTFDGYGYSINQDMASLGNSAKSLIFGDLKKFKIRRVRDIQMMRLVERYAEFLQIGFLAFQRFDSNIVDAGTHPIMYFQNSAT
jgi:HK97 family phage major capsid protein